MHNKDDLLNLLREHYDNGMGGILELDVKECILKADDVISELKAENLVSWAPYLLSVWNLIVPVLVIQ